MEEGTNKGGILVDDMGLGKTISTLALMLARLASSRSKTNLIIGPLSLITQWEEEIKAKPEASHTVAVFRYYGKKAAIHDHHKYDVVVTTYGILAQELKNRDVFKEENKSRIIEYNDKSVAAKFPLLHPNTSFHRIILDEGQCIKNGTTNTAKACYSLKATYRWCLTSTLMMNGVVELYSLLNFLCIKLYNRWNHFRKAFSLLFGERGDPKSIAMSALQALLKATMLRRKKDSKLDGKRILQLPPKREHSVYVTLSANGREFYEQLEEKAQVVFRKYLRKSSVRKNHSNILVLLLRLRQAYCHSHLNLDVDDAVRPISDTRLEKVVTELNAPTIRRIKGVKALKCPVCFDAVPTPSLLVPCGHDCCWDCVLRVVDNAASQQLREGDESDKAVYPVCRGAFNLSECFPYELFEKIHMPETVGTDNRTDNADSSEDERHVGYDHASGEVSHIGSLQGLIGEDEDELPPRGILAEKAIAKEKD